MTGYARAKKIIEKSMIHFYVVTAVWGMLGAWLVSGWLWAGGGWRGRLVVGVALFVWRVSFAGSMVWQFKTGHRFPRALEYATALSMPWFVWTPCIFVVLDALRLARFLPAGAPVRRWIGVGALALMAALTAYGIWNASRTRVVTHRLEMARLKAPLNVVVVSDLHLESPIVSVEFLQRAADQLEALEPDLVLIPGDVLDWEATPLANEALMAQVGRLKGKYGTFVCEGNHDLFAGALPQLERALEACGMTFLADHVNLVETPSGTMAVAGRSWPRAEQHFIENQGGNRVPLERLLAGVPEDIFRIVLDHSPQFYREAVDAADLQVSGHTHAGQFFPVSLVTKCIFDNHWGVLRTNRLTQVTTCGLSTWNAPVRIGTRSEVVQLLLSPAPDAESLAFGAGKKSSAGRLLAASEEAHP